MISLWKRVYGESPLHLLGQLVAIAITIYAIRQIIGVASTDRMNLFVWLVAGAVLHDLIFVPVYLVLDLVTRLGIRDHHHLSVRAINHIRFPAAISGVMLLALFPLILGKNEEPFMRAAGEAPPDYLSRWLLITAIVFGVSALAYAVRLRRGAGGAPPAPRPLSTHA